MTEQTSPANYLPDSIRVSLLVTRILEKLGVEYLIGGSMASTIHGKPRLTNDVDLVADIKESQVESLVSALESDFYVDELALRRAIRERSSLNIIYLPTMFKADIYIWRGDDWAQEQMRSRVEKPLIENDDSTVRQFSDAETTILQKLSWYRKGGEVSQKQWEDVIGVLQIQREALDSGYLRHWAAKLGVLDLLEKALPIAGFSG
ncbi:MAG: hypothetical protein ACREEM_19300 [Blastocatellia bacterium]